MLTTTDLPPHLARYAELAGTREDFLAALREPLPQTLFANGTRVTATRLTELVGDAFSLTPLAWRPGAFRLANHDRPGRHWSFTSGLFTVQEEASLLPVAMLDVRPGHRALDLCAAPGNKSAQIALALGNRGTLLANDLKTGRLSALHDLCRRLGLVNVSSTGHDGSVLPVDDGQFDRILVDAPCTAEGKARRGYVRDSPEGFRRWVTGQQRALLRRAAGLLTSGGRIVYSTCTFAPEENEAVVDDLLRRAEGALELLDPREAGLPLPVGAAPGLTAFENLRFDETLTRCVRLWPQQSDTGGFFAALLRRTDTPLPAHFTANPSPPAASEALPTLAPDHPIFPALRALGLRDEQLEAYRFFEDQRHFRIVAADHRPPPGVARENTGIDVARRRSRVPKLSTAGAMAVAQDADGRVVDLDDDRFQRWRAREDLVIDSELSRGVVLVRHRGLVHGTAFLHRESPSGSTARLESQFPKAWMLGELHTRR